MPRRWCSLHRPEFVTCFGQYQSALVSAAVAGVDRPVQTVTSRFRPGSGLRLPDHLDSPGLGTAVKGQAFIVGGRIEAPLVPTTNGRRAPSAFASAYDAVTGRMARAVASSPPRPPDRCRGSGSGRPGPAGR